MIMKFIKSIMQRNDPPPELHTCPNCGAPLTRMHLIRGGIIKNLCESKVKATIGCRDCRHIHTVRGESLRHHWLVLQLLNNTRAISMKSVS